MPIYEYECQDCGHSFEYLVLGDPDPACQSCASKKVCRLMSVCGFYSKDGGGETIKSSASASSCSGCTTTSNCAGCGHG
ncbi:MAG: zinc ribbon domain-containing protein [Desulfobacterales bacterium]|nr:zinc ribbon domain-containing protein [Desulfobacterales bacterium]